MKKNENFMKNGINGQNRKIHLFFFGIVILGKIISVLSVFSMLDS